MAPEMVALPLGPVDAVPPERETAWAGVRRTGSFSSVDCSMVLAPWLPVLTVS
jgi:hypothetical protein